MGVLTYKSPVTSYNTIEPVGYTGKPIDKGSMLELMTCAPPFRSSIFFSALTDWPLNMTALPIYTPKKLITKRPVVAFADLARTDKIVPAGIATFMRPFPPGTIKN